MGKILMAMVDSSTGTVYNSLNDRLGNPHLMTDDTGLVVWEAYHKPFGETKIHPSSILQMNIRLPGHYFDAETGLHYNWHRYYDFKTGRYLTPDPIGLRGGINRYVYAQNNPANITDPDGLLPIIPILLGAWVAVEVGLSVWDAVSTVETVLDPCESTESKIFSVGLFGVGMVAPGGGYSAGFKFTKKMLSTSEVMFRGREISKVDELVSKFGGKTKEWVKKKGWDEHGQEWHWYENKGKRVGRKPAGAPDPF